MDSTTEGLKCLAAVAMESAFTSHSSQVIWATLSLAVKNPAPNLKDKFIIRKVNLDKYNLRNAHINLSVPKPKTEYLKKSFGYSGAVLFNSLLKEAKLTESISSFKNMVQKVFDRVRRRASSNFIFLNFFIP